MVYLGVFEQYKAAIIYDIATIQLNGLVARTNHSYNKRQVASVLKLPNLIKVARGEVSR